MKFRSKIVEIEAWPFDGSWESASPIVQMSDKLFWSDSGGGTMSIETLEGVMTANAGDWIIRGTEGEFYPCKPSVFERKYEPLTSIKKAD